MIIDCSLFHTEIELFTLRYMLLKDIVDQFLVLEGTSTFSGKPKQLQFPMALCPERVQYVTYDTPQWARGDWTPWRAEFEHRRALYMHILRYTPKDTDWIILSDADEIPHPATVETVRDNHAARSHINVFEQYLSYYYLNARADFLWQGSRMVTFGMLKTILHGDMQQLRVSPGTLTATGGWHFSYTGGEDRIHDKISSFAHTELDTSEVHGRINAHLRNLTDPFGRGIEWHVIPIDSTFPWPVQDNPENYKELIYAA
jgi:beta-1,4-mannosyl-glycoprotein beta-1,4-N-acetylglucosaminyltransferase